MFNNCKVYSSLKDTIGGADLAGMQVISKGDKCAVSLKDKRTIIFSNAF